MGARAVPSVSALTKTNDKPKKSTSLWSDAWKRLKKNKASVYSSYFVIFVCLVALFADVIAPYPFDQQNMNELLKAPNARNLLGTDSLGRDLLSRIIYGARVSMAVAIITALISLVLGTIYGSIAGWYGGKIDSLFMRVIDILYSIPELILLIFVMVVFTNSNLVADPELKAIISIILALSLTGWAGVARMVRGQVLQVKQMLYVEAATALGASQSMIVLRHILPNILGAIIVTLTFQIPANILYESFLSFIGLGLQPPFSSWGVLASEGWRSLKTYPHLTIYPGIALFLTMLAFNLFGDGLRDAFDPKMKNR